jgi:hypothetical protein
MAASVSGFLAPGLIAAFVLRTPDQVSASRHGRELAPAALAAPLSSLLVLVGVVYLRNHPVFEVQRSNNHHDGTMIRRRVDHHPAAAEADHHHHHYHHQQHSPIIAVTESTTLVDIETDDIDNDNNDDDDNDDDDDDDEDSQFVPLPHVFEPSTEAHRRDSSIIMGIPQFEWLESSSPEQSQHKST